MNWERSGVQSDCRVGATDETSEVGALNVIDIIVYNGNREAVATSRWHGADARHISEVDTGCKSGTKKEEFFYTLLVGLLH